MNRRGESQRKFKRRRAIPGARRCLFLLLAIAFAASTVLHIPGAGPAYGASAPHSHGPASLMQDCGGAPFCPGGDGDHGATCSMAGSCFLSLPATVVAAFVVSDVTPAGLEPEPGHFGNIPSPRFRPPKPGTNA